MLTVITLTTDFGYTDPFAGIMKGVIYGINPSAVITDITHGIPAHDVRQASLAIGESYGYFPRGSIHVVVVDPGVGSKRRPVIVQARGHFFVGPDNGVFTRVLEVREGEDEALRVWHITNKNYFLPVKGPTFHARDIFAPVAAWLSKGVPPGDIGQSIDGPEAIGTIGTNRAIETIETPQASVRGNVVSGEVISIDHFGNAITNITLEDLGEVAREVGYPEELGVDVQGNRAIFQTCYSEAARGRDDDGKCFLCAVINSSGRLEIFIFKGNAAREFALEVGHRVKVSPN